MDGFTLSPDSIIMANPAMPWTWKHIADLRCRLRFWSGRRRRSDKFATFARF